MEVTGRDHHHRLDQIWRGGGSRSRRLFAGDANGARDSKSLLIGTGRWKVTDHGVRNLIAARRRRAWAVALVSMIAGSGTAALIADADAPTTVTFSATGGEQTFTVPSGVTSV